VKDVMVTFFWMGVNLAERNHGGDAQEEGKIILKYIVRKYVIRLQNVSDISYRQLPYLRESNAHLNFQNLETKKKYLLANVMCIGKKCTLYNNEFLLRIQFYKNALFFDKLIISYTLTRKKAQKHTTVEFNFTKKKHYSLINFY
jgi:hypothetical protein